MVKLYGHPNITTPPTVLLAMINGYKEYSIPKAFSKKGEIAAVVTMAKKMNLVPLQYLEQVDSIINMCLAIIDDLEQNGFRDYWEQKIEPLAIKRCKEFQEVPISPLYAKLIKQFDPQFKIPEEIDIYFCPLHKPYGTSLNFAFDIIIQDDMSTDYTLMLIAHEIFHPLCAIDRVGSESIRIIAEKPWVIEGFKNRGDLSPYNEMGYFIEENIVDALGVYVAYKLDFEIDPYQYFRSRNNGSHVISPKFFDYLLAHPKDISEEFETYLYNFACTL